MVLTVGWGDEEGAGAGETISPTKVVRKHSAAAVRRAVTTRYKRMDLTKPAVLWGWKEIEPPVPVTKHLTCMPVPEKGGGRSSCPELSAELYLNAPLYPVGLDGIDGGSAEGCFWASADRSCDL